MLALLQNHITFPFTRCGILPSGSPTISLHAKNIVPCLPLTNMEWIALWTPKTMPKLAIFKLLKLPLYFGAAHFSVFIITIILSHSETTLKSSIFKLLMLPWCSPPFPVHSTYNTKPYGLNCPYFVG